MKTILVHNTVKEYKEFKEILQNSLVQYKVITSDENYNYDEVEFLVIWYEIPSDLDLLSNLKLILNCGSGFDQYLKKIDLFNKNIPIVRLVDPYLKERVSNYILNYVKKIISGKIFFNNNISIAQQRTKIVIMGVGILGNYTAIKLLKEGYYVVGWSKSKKNKSLYKSTSGKINLYNEIKNCHFLICQLPLTNETENIIDSELLENMNKDGFLINIGRGEHIIENDLVNAIENNKISGAILDVNRVEPVPDNHVYKNIKNLILTPHIAGYIGANTQAVYASKIINDFLLGNKMVGLFDFKKKY